MRNILVLLMLFSFNCVASNNDLLLINGKWDCSPEPSNTMILTNTIEYKTSDMSFIHNGRVTFIQADGVESTLELLSVGIFQYESLTVEEKINSLDIKIVKDESGFLKGAEESLRKSMLSETASLVTKSITNKHWILYNAKTGETTECEKL